MLATCAEDKFAVMGITVRRQARASTRSGGAAGGVDGGNPACQADLSPAILVRFVIPENIGNKPTGLIDY